MYNLAELLKLRVGAQEIQVSKISTGGTTRSIAAAATGSARATVLGGEIKQIDASTLLVATSLCRLRGGGRGGSGGGGSGLTSLLLLLDVVGDTLIYMSVASQRPTRGGKALTVKRYSTALSGLLKAARMAASIWLRSKPMASMLVMAAARSAPMVRPAESPPAAASASALRLGVGVAGGAVLWAADDWLGAAGTAGVPATGWAGVAGGAAADGAATTGFSLG